MLAKTKKALTVITALSMTVSVAAIEESFKAGKDSQKAAELAETEKRLDDQIRQISERLQAMYTLRDIGPKVKQSPTQTIFSMGKDEDGEYIELVAYTFNPQSYNYGRPVGTAAKTMRLYFTGKDLSKIKTIVDDQNFYEQYKYYTKAVHPLFSFIHFYNKQHFSSSWENVVGQTFNYLLLSIILKVHVLASGCQDVQDNLLQLDTDRQQML